MRLGVIAIGIAAVMVASGAMANPGVEARQALMKSIVGNVKAIAGVVKGQSDESLSDVARRAGEIETAADKMGGVFGDRVHVDNAGGVRTTASPAIWDRWAEFFNAGVNLEAAAVSLQTAAASGNMDAVKGAFGGMTKTCGACHKPFRIKKKK